MALSQRMRIWHRYLGFFLAGVMAVYATTGITLVFRKTDTFKQERAYAKTVDPELNAQQLGRALGLRNLAIERTVEDLVYFPNGTYNSRTGEANYTKKELPFFLDKLTKLHKATTASPLYGLNLFFGASLLFFVVSGIWMYLPSGPVLRKGLLFTAAGIAVVLLMLFV